MIRRNRRRPKPIKDSPFMHLWPELAYMPPLNHWPDRPGPFAPDRSEILAYIVEGFSCDIPMAEKIFQSARSKGVIRYNPETRRWCGCKGGQP
jgi:hypothetical protein